MQPTRASRRYRVPLLFALVFVIVLGVSAANAQRNKLIILVRHAEKAAGENVNQSDPDLSDAGRARAARFAEVIGRYRPGAFYSTDFKRTRDTLAPLAAKREKTVELYDARKPDDLFKKILASDIKRHVVAGHSNTIPALANLITGKKVFRDLEDSEYTVIWLIRLKDGKVTKMQLLDY